MKILFVTYHLNLTGSPLTLFRLVKELSKEKKLEIEILAFYGGPLEKRYQELGIHPMIENLYDTSPANIAKIAKVIRDNKIDLVVSHMLYSINGVFAAHHCAVPNMLYILEDWASVNTSILHLAAFKLADKILLSAEFQKAVYQPLLEKAPLEILGDSVPFDLFSGAAIKETREKIKKDNNIPDGKKIVSIIGDVCNRKRQNLFIFAAHEILKKRNDVVFLIIGRHWEDDQYYQLLKKYVQAGGLEPSIVFLGEKEDIQKYHYISDVVVCASTNDITPLVLIEALAFKKPVVATSIDGIPEIVKDGENGLLIEPNDQKQLEDAVLKVLDNYDKFQQQIEKGYAAFKAKYDIRERVNSLLNLINKTKPGKKEMDFILSKDEMQFAFKEKVVLKYKEITPLIARRVLPGSS